ncbi:MAG: SEC-C domain-containing protein [Chlamydiales bacterium]|nr:SEC-C domain-containing protein [Chlamydiales bacterium]
MDAKRNDPCPCGSGKKYKKCHGQIDAEMKKTQRSYSMPGDSKNPALSFAQKIIKVLESTPPAIDRTKFPESKASTKEAENPELTPPILPKVEIK